MRMLLSVLSVAALAVAGTACGVPNDYVKQETLTAFSDTGDVAAHVKAKCGGRADDDCTDIQKKLIELCTRLDNLAKKAGGSGFDCTAWKANP